MAHAAPTSAASPPRQPMSDRPTGIRSRSCHRHVHLRKPRQPGDAGQIDDPVHGRRASQTDGRREQSAGSATSACTASFVHRAARSSRALSFARKALAAAMSLCGYVSIVCERAGDFGREAGVHPIDPVSKRRAELMLLQHALVARPVKEVALARSILADRRDRPGDRATAATARRTARPQSQIIGRDDDLCGERGDDVFAQQNRADLAKVAASRVKYPTVSNDGDWVIMPRASIRPWVGRSRTGRRSLRGCAPSHRNRCRARRRQAHPRPQRRSRSTSRPVRDPARAD